MAKYHVNDGVWLACDKQIKEKPIKFKITHHNNIKLSGEYKASEADNVPIENIGVFSDCQKHKSCKIKEAKLEWENVIDNGTKINGYRPLHLDSNCVCDVGFGNIYIYTDEQKAKEFIASNNYTDEEKADGFDETVKVVFFALGTAGYAITMVLAALIGDLATIGISSIENQKNQTSSLIENGGKGLVNKQLGMSGQPLIPYSYPYSISRCNLPLKTVFSEEGVCSLEELLEMTESENKKKLKELEEKYLKDVKSAGLEKKYKSFTIEEKINVLTSIENFRTGHFRETGKEISQKKLDKALNMWIKRPEYRASSVFIWDMNKEFVTNITEDGIYVNFERWEKGDIRYYDGREIEILEKLDSWDGLQAMLIKDLKTGKNMLVYQGSNPGIGEAYKNPIGYAKDWANNLMNTFSISKTPLQYDTGLKFAREMDRKYGVDILLGHSLGGGVATYTSSYTGIQSIAFDSAPVNNPGKYYKQSYQLNIFPIKAQLNDPVMVNGYVSNIFDPRPQMINNEKISAYEYTKLSRALIKVGITSETGVISYENSKYDTWYSKEKSKWEENRHELGDLDDRLDSMIIRIEDLSY